FLNTVRSNKGSALVYILIAIALLAALTVTFMEPSSQQTSSQNTFKTVSSVKRQADFIQSALQECILSFSDGDNEIDTSESGTDPGARTNYPIAPNSEYYDGSEDGQYNNRFVRNLRCPGDKLEPEPTNEHQKMFGGGGGKFLPPAPDFFSEWKYYNGTDGVYYWIETDKSDAFLTTALKRIDDNFSECEADVINATGGAIDLDSGSPAQTQCPNNSLCLRVWLISNRSTAVYPGQEEIEAECSQTDS
ncbi:MAG: hypothetical protein AAF182_02000, partial [Pseudomonadota bacterium]